MEQTLVLNASFEPLRIVPWQRAVTLFYQGKAEIIETHEREARAVSFSFRLPSVVRLLYMVKLRRRPVVQFTRANIYARDEFTCFGAGTRILMADGRQLAIEDVTVGDRVIDAHGQPTEVVATASRVADDAVSLKTRGSSQRLVTTPDHPFLRPDAEYRPIREAPEYLVMPRAVAHDTPTEVTVNVSALMPDRWMRARGGRLYWSRRGHEHGFPAVWLISAEAAYALGAFVADGSATGPTVTWALNIGQKATIATRLRRWLDGLGLESAEDTRDGTANLAVRTSNKTLSLLLRLYCGGGKYGEKRIPWALIGPHRKAFLRGLFEGDGHIDRVNRKVSLWMTSYDSVFGAQSMLWSIGIHPTVHEVERPNRKYTFGLVLCAENYSRFMKCVCGEAVEDGDRIFGNDAYVFRRFQALDRIDGETEVFNLETASHSFIANGLAVHNCQYCSVQHEPERLTFDHVVPVAQGGRRGWDNIVTACEPCNRRKAARTPAEAGMTLLRTPRRPIILPPTVKLTVGFKTPATWASWLYWHIELDRS